MAALKPSPIAAMANTVRIIVILSPSRKLRLFSAQTKRRVTIPLQYTKIWANRGGKKSRNRIPAHSYNRCPGACRNEHARRNEQTMKSVYRYSKELHFAEPPETIWPFVA